MAEKFVLIGTGNVAWHLGSVLENAGHLLVHVYDRKLGHAKNLHQIILTQAMVTQKT